MASAVAQAAAGGVAAAEYEEVLVRLSSLITHKVRAHSGNRGNQWDLMAHYLPPDPGAGGTDRAHEGDSRRRDQRKELASVCRSRRVASVEAMMHEVDSPPSKGHYSFDYSNRKAREGVGAVRYDSRMQDVSESERVVSQGPNPLHN